MTGILIQLTMLGMSNTGPGRRPSSSSEYKLAFIRRVIEARKNSGLTPAQMAAKLQELSGRKVPYDSYRKYELEDVKKGSFLRHDLIYPFCEITRIHPFFLLDGRPFQMTKKEAAKQRNVA